MASRLKIHFVLLAPLLVFHLVDQMGMQYLDRLDCIVEVQRTVVERPYAGLSQL